MRRNMGPLQSERSDSEPLETSPPMKATWPMRHGLWKYSRRFSAWAKASMIT